MSLIDGIGGAFLFSNNPKGLAEWYRENLGMNYDESPDGSSMYTAFSHRDLNDASLKRTTAWAVLRSDSDINSKPRTGKINYRVKSMNEVLSHLKARGVKIDKTEEYEFGKFATLTDPEGNKIELWEEPPEAV
jgi:predicted enzyme related to lactoylglutathione lyase